MCFNKRYFQIQEDSFCPWDALGSCHFSIPVFYARISFSLTAQVNCYHVVCNLFGIVLYCVLAETDQTTNCFCYSFSIEFKDCFYYYRSGKTTRKLTHTHLKGQLQVFTSIKSKGLYSVLSPDMMWWTFIFCQVADISPAETPRKNMTFIKC